MKALLFLLALTLIAGCGPQPESVSMTKDEGKASPTTTGGAAQSKYSEAELGIPFYPGSEAVEGGAVTLSTDIGETKGVVRLTKDTPVQVAEFYAKEGAKVGKLRDVPVLSDKLRSVAVDLPDGTQWAVQTMAGEDGKTMMHLNHFYPKKK